MTQDTQHRVFVRLGPAERALYEAGERFGAARAMRSAAAAVNAIGERLAADVEGDGEEAELVRAAAREWAAALAPLAASWEATAVANCTHGNRDLDRCLHLRAGAAGLSDRLRGAILGAMRGFRAEKKG